MNLLTHITRQQTGQALLGQLNPGLLPSVSLCLCATSPSLTSALFFVCVCVGGVFIISYYERVFFVGGESGSTSRKESGVLPQ